MASPGAWALELLFPRTCVLCAAPLLPSGGPRRGGALSAAPLCPSCLAGLMPAGPPRCARCGTPLSSELRLCLRCRSAAFAFDSAWPLWSFAGPPAALVAAFKFGSRRSLAPFLAELLARRAAEFPGATFVPVPCSPASLRRRGWDQAALLVAHLARRGFPSARLLSRAPGRAQKTLDYPGRMSNLAGAIGFLGREAPPLVVLVDDVLTTGATLSACAAVLKERGARRVDALVLAAD